MDFRVLGPVDVVDGERHLNLGGPKQQTVLALLLASAGQRVAVDTLITGVYGEDAAPSAKRTIHTYVSNLRHELGDLIASQGGSYHLMTTPRQIDSARFEGILRDAAALLTDEPETAGGMLREALGMWRGHPYGRIDGGPVVEAEIRRLEELRVSALEKRIDADLALGLNHELIGELDALVTGYPYQEHFRAQHMLALYRSDRQSDALRAYARARAFLGEELGLEPGPGLQLLEDRILAQDPTLDIAPRPTIERRAILVSDLPDRDGIAHPSRRDHVMARRDKILETELSRLGGVLVGFRGSAAYASVPAVTDALQIARSLADEGLSVAVDFGEVEIREGNVSGPPLGRSARLVATSHPGQVLISEPAQTALSSSGAAGWSVRSLGRHQIHGVEGPLLVFQATGHGLDADFPPLQLDRLPPPVPTEIPPVAGYELRARLAEHEHGIVYTAYQHSVGREVALLLFRPELVSDPRFVRRFEAEAHRLVRLDHPNLVSVLDYWRTPDQAAIVSPARPRRDLSTMLTRPLDARMVVSTIARIGRGLAYAHERGVVHGRLHPSLITLDEDGEPSVAGLGVAWLTQGIIPLTATEYTAPEMLEEDLGPPADVFSLGAIAVELLTGTSLPRDRALPSVPGVMGQVIARALDPDPASRQGSMRLFTEELLSAQGSPTGTPESGAASDVRNPYKGLRTFTEGDTGDFFGRERLTGELVAAMSAANLTVVVGPSGIGKSSLVRAGLVPALRRGALEGSEDWMITDMFPGTHPFEELGEALSRIAIRTPSGHVDRLERGEITLAELCQLVTAGDPTVLIVDQLEELFTHVVDERERRSFLRMLAETARSEPGQVKVVATLRADFFDRPLEDPEFGAAIGQHIVPVHALDLTELGEAIRGPAGLVGVEVDVDLAAALAEDAIHEPGGLPLLQHTLTEMFARRGRDRLALGDYRRSGGLVGSIGRRAESTYLGLTPEARAATREVFIRLVTVDEAHQDTRRRIRLSELERLSVGRDAVETVLDAFGRHRLLTFDRDPATRSPTVEVAHEAILGQWDRLAGWIDSVRDDLLARRQIDTAARQWDEAGREASYLLGGARLETAEDWEGRTGLELSELERDFLVESRQAWEESQLARRRTRRRVVVGLSLGLVMVSIFGLIALAQGRAAERRALENRIAALTDEAVLAIDQDPELAILLALAAYDTSRQSGGSTPVDVANALQRTLQESSLERVIDDGLEAITASPDGTTVALHGREDPRVLRLYDLNTGQILRERRLSAPITGLGFTPDGSQIAVAFDPESLGSVAMLDSSTLDTVHQITTHAFSLSFSDDGRFMTGWDEDRTLIWDLENGYEQTEVDGGLWGVFLPDSTVLARMLGRELQFLDVEAPTELFRVDLGAEFESVAAHPEGDLVAASDWEGDRVAIVGFQGREVVQELGGFASPRTISFSADGSTLLVGGASPVASVVDLATWERTELPGHGAGVTTIGASGNRYLAQTLDLGVRVWRADARLPEDGSIQFEPGDVFLSTIDPETERAAGVTFLSGSEAAVGLLDTGTGRILGRSEFFYDAWAWPLLSHRPGVAIGLAPGSRLGSVVDLASGETLLELRPCEVPTGVNANAGLVGVRADCKITRQSEGPEPARSGVVRIADGSLAMGLPHDPSLVAFGEPGTSSEDLAFVANWAEVQVWRISTGRLVGSWEPVEALGADQILPIGFSSDGRTAFAGYVTGRLVVFDVLAIDEGRPLSEALRFQIQAHAGPLKLAQAAGDHIVTSGPEVKSWNLGTGELELEIHSPADAAVAITPDGSDLYFEAGDGLMRLTPIGAPELAALARYRVHRDLTDDECLRFLDLEECPPAPDGER